MCLCFVAINVYCTCLYDVNYLLGGFGAMVRWKEFLSKDAQRMRRPLSVSRRTLRKLRGDGYEAGSCSEVSPTKRMMCILQHYQLVRNVIR